MNKPRITILGSHNTQLLEFLESHPDGHERAAAVLFRKISRRVEDLPDSDKYVSVKVIPFEQEWIIGSSPSHVDFVRQPLREIYRECEENDLTFGFVHIHPPNFNRFSEKDDLNEVSLLAAIVNRNGMDSSLVAMVWVGGEWIARVRNGKNPQVAVAARHTLVIGERLEIYGEGLLDENKSEMLARQSAAFGKPFSAKLNSLRYGVVGCSGTGSPSISLLARSGAGEIIGIDYDPFDKSNINRVRGSKVRDQGKNKALIQKDFIGELGLPCKFAAIQAPLDTSYEAVAALSTVDVIFGCTDDWAGRDLMNKALYYYGACLIDVGLGGLIDEGDDSQPYLRSHSGRVSCILPEWGQCLYCQGVVREEWVKHQLAVRANPVIAAQDAQDGYLQGGGTAAPGVGPFTSATADFSVGTLFDLIKPYRKFSPEQRRDLFFIDFVNMRIKSVETPRNLECPYCEQRLFLTKRETSYLLGRPTLRPDKE